MDVAVLIVAHQRPDTLETIVRQLEKANVQKIYISVDGPSRSDGEGNFNYQKVLEFVLNDPYLKLHAQTQIQKQNKGLRLHIINALNWVFGMETRAIVLEDDCVPSVQFLQYCKEMLDKYENIDRVMHISGFTFLNIAGKNSNHRLSNLHSVWGWATWARAWKKNNEIQIDWKPFTYFIFLYRKFRSAKIAFWFLRYLREAEYDTRKVWSTNWSFSILQSDGVGVSPATNLISNLGINDDSSTHKVSVKDQKMFLYYEVDKYHNSNIPMQSIVDYDLDRDEFEFIAKIDSNVSLRKNARFIVEHMIWSTLKKFLKFQNKKRV